MSNAADIRSLLTGVLLFAGAAVATAGGSGETGVLAERVREALGQHTLPGVETALAIGGIPRDLRLPEEPWEVRVLLPAGCRLKGNVRCVAEIVRKNAVVMRIPLTVTARTTADVLVAERLLERHAAISAGDVRVQRIETTAYAEAPTVGAAELAGMRLKRIVPAGAVLLRSMFEPVPLVRSGRPVTIFVTTGAVRVRTTGVARRDGNRGDRVGVRPSNSRQQITGVVIGNDVVEVTAE